MIFVRGSRFVADLTFGALGLIGGQTWTGVTDWRKEYPYADLVKSSRGFKPTGDPYGSTDVAFKGNGWPSTDFVSVLLTDGSTYDAGVYNCSFTGQASSVGKPGGAGNGTISSLTYNGGTNKTTFTVTASSSIDSIQLQFNGISADFADYEFMMPGYTPGTAPLLRTQWANHISYMGTFRFMDWLGIANSTDTTYAGSNASKATSKYLRRNSIVGCAEACNALGKKGWFNIHAQFNDADTLSEITDLMATLIGSGHYIEPGNEPWNFGQAQAGQLMAAMKTAANVRTGSTEITSVVRASNVVTVVFAAAHGRTTNDSIYIGGVTNITDGLNTVTVTNSTTLTFAQTGSDVTGTVASNNNSYVFLTPANQWCKPLTTFGTGAYPDAYRAKDRWVVDRARACYAALVTIGETSRAKVVIGGQLVAVADANSMLAYAVMQYGDCQWLTISPAYYAQPSNPSAMTTEALVWADLDAVRIAIAINALGYGNTLASWGRPMVAYEGGPHTDSKPNTTVATAVSAAHNSDTMRLFIKGLYQDWLNRAGGVLCYYTSGVTDTFDNVGNNTWPLLLGDVTNTAQAKMAAIVELFSTAATPAQLGGINWGTIPYTGDTMGWSTGNGNSNNNRIVATTLACPDHAVNVVAATAGNYSLTINACSGAGSSDWITVKVNGAVVASQVACPNQNPFAGEAPQLWAGTVALTKGVNVVSLQIKPATRAGQLGLRNLVLA